MTDRLFCVIDTEKIPVPSVLSFRPIDRQERAFHPIAECQPASWPRTRSSSLLMLLASSSRIRRMTCVRQTLVSSLVDLCNPWNFKSAARLEVVIKRFKITFLAVLFGLATALVLQAHGQNFDFESARVPISEIDSAWKFHLGDDPRWSQPGFDDSQWQVLKPTEQWSTQGYPAGAELAWFRFRLRVPPQTGSLVLQLPEIAKSFQLFSDGMLIGQVGKLPPGPVEDASSAARLFTLRVNSGATSKEIVLAFRLWQDPSMPGTRYHGLGGPVYVGAPDAVTAQFNNAKAANLLASGSTYTVDILILIVGAATILLYWLTRERFYLWFACYLILTASFLPIDLAAAHQSWSYHFQTYLNIVIDVLANAAWSLFLVEAVRPGRWRLALAPIALAFVADVAVTLVLVHQISIKWGDITYCVANIAVWAVLAVYLIRGWRAGNGYARLLFVPFAIGAASLTVSNLYFALADLNLAPSFNMLPSHIFLLQQPFTVSLMDLCTTTTELGMLIVLVYRFARTNREEQRLSASLRAAHDIQHRLIPMDVPGLGALSVEVAYRAAEEVGGDFCQILPRPDGSIFVAIGDVSGKGLQAAMLGALAVGAIRAIATGTIGPAAALERLNTVLQTENTGFVTCLCLVLSEKAPMVIANAGHLPPYLNGAEVPLEASLPLGIVSTISYEQASVSLPAEARLTLLSDGVVEARSRSGELFGFHRTTEISHLSASEIADRAYHFGQEDDITVVTLDWKTGLSSPGLSLV